MHAINATPRGECLRTMYRSDTSSRYAVRIGSASPPWTVRQERPFAASQVSAYPRFRRNLSGMRRSVVDYGLARRATLASVLARRATVAAVCDAHPYLLLADT